MIHLHENFGLDGSKINKMTFLILNIRFGKYYILTYFFLLRRYHEMRGDEGGGFRRVGRDRKPEA